jgi:hypothetical protein
MVVKKPTPPKPKSHEPSVRRAQTAKKLKAGAAKSVAPPILTEKPPRTKHGGRVAGTKNRATVTKDELLQDALNGIFGGMDEVEMYALCKKPLEVLEMLLLGALKARSFILARGLATDILPYREVKLVAPPPPVDPDAPPIVFEIRGGLPQKL